ncbi:NAD(P)-binding domain-containing protein [Streptomyces phaeochromogenes]
MKVGLIGLGAMGSGVALNLLKAGHHGAGVVTTTAVRICRTSEQV